MPKKIDPPQPAPKRIVDEAMRRASLSSKLYLMSKHEAHAVILEKIQSVFPELRRQ